MDKKFILRSKIVQSLHVLHSAIESIRESIITAWLFTNADFKTILFPVMVFSIASNKIHSPLTILRAFVWTWFHLLQCNVSNQARSKAEDAVNKPWRPLPSNRITEEHVRILRWVVVGWCITISSIYGVVPASAFLTFTTYCHDDWLGSGHWVSKTILNSFGYFSFEVGASQIIGGSSALTERTVISLICSAITIILTIHAQDFADVVGDLKSSRLTFPIVFPSASRIYMFCVLSAWSIALTSIWDLGATPYLAVAFNVLACYIGWRVYRFRDEENDKRTYIIYNVWLMWVHILPALTARNASTRRPETQLSTAYAAAMNPTVWVGPSAH